MQQVDVGTGSVRSSVCNSVGHILAVETYPLKIWNDQEDFYEVCYLWVSLVLVFSEVGDVLQQSSEDIWRAICITSRSVIASSGVSSEMIRGVGFDATCSLYIISHLSSSFSRKLLTCFQGCTWRER